jgi:hypothetical protein
LPCLALPAELPFKPPALDFPTPPASSPSLGHSLAFPRSTFPPAHLLPFLQPVSAHSLVLLAFSCGVAAGRFRSPWLPRRRSCPSSGLGFAAGDSGGFVIRPRAAPAAAAAGAERRRLSRSPQRVLRASARSVTPASLPPASTPLAITGKSRRRGPSTGECGQWWCQQSLAQLLYFFFLHGGSRRVVIGSLISLPA